VTQMPRLTTAQVAQQAEAAIQVMRRHGCLYTWWESKGFTKRERARIEKAIEEREVKPCPPR